MIIEQGHSFTGVALQCVTSYWNNTVHIISHLIRKKLNEFVPSLLISVFSRHHFTTRWTELKNKHTHETDSATWEKNTQHKNGRPIFLPYFREEIVISRKHDTEQLVLINYAMSGFNF